MANSSTPVQITLIVAGISASATIAAAVVTWLKDRNGAARRIQALDEAQKYVDFLDSCEGRVRGVDIEKWTQTPSPSPDLFPAQTLTGNSHTDWYYKRGHFRRSTYTDSEDNLIPVGCSSTTLNP